MDFHLRDKLHKVDQAIFELAQQIDNFNTITKTKIMSEGFNKKCDIIYKNYINELLKEKKDLLKRQLDIYNDEESIMEAKNNYYQFEKYADLLLKQNFKWV